MAEKVTHIRLKWAGGEHRFLLDLDPPNNSRALHDAPRLHDRIRAVLGRLIDGTWGAEDVSGPIRLGLIGGGEFLPNRRSLLDPWKEVDALVSAHVLRRPLAESVPLAQTILMAAITGVDPSLADAGLSPVQAMPGDLDQTADEEAA
jgi:hypothetical protein